MIQFIAALVLEQVSPGPMFARAYRAHLAQKAATVTVNTTTVAAGGVRKAEYKIAFRRPDQARIGYGGRVYYVLGRKAFAYDQKAQEYITRTLPARMTLVESMSFFIGSLDEAIQTALEPSNVAGLLKRFEAVPHWKQERSKRQLIFTSDSGVRLAFGGNTSLLEEIRMRANGNEMQWRFAYGPPSSIAFRPPAGAIKVESFLEGPPKPTYETVGARELVEASARKYDTLHSGKVAVGGSTIWFAPAKIRELQQRVEWAYSDGVLTIKDRASGRVYSGKTPYSSVSNYLEKLGTLPDPAVRQLTTRRNMMRALLSSISRIKRVGDISVGGTTYQIVQIDEPLLRVSCWLRGDRLIARVTSESLDRAGSVVTRSEREFSYSDINKAVPPKTFQIEGKALPLQRLVKS
jgi:hypothetical protein